MILAIDCGNTHITVGCVEGEGSVDAVFCIPTDRRETAFGYAAKMKEIFDLQGVDLGKIEGAAISCVVPPIKNTLADAVRLMIGKEALIVGAGVKTGLSLSINDPGTVAADLVAAAVAAKEEYPLPCVIVDMGSATTVTVVDGKGRFIGGAILPGASVSLTALVEHTALLPHIEIRPPEKAIASHTVDCMKSGIVYGAAGAVDGIIDRFAAELDGEIACIVATGGIAPMICPHCRHSIRLDETLLLKGLAIIWRKNQR